MASGCALALVLVRSFQEAQGVGDVQRRRGHGRNSKYEGRCGFGTIFPCEWPKPKWPMTRLEAGIIFCFAVYLVDGDGRRVGGCSVKSAGDDILVPVSRAGSVRRARFKGKHSILFPAKRKKGKPYLVLASIAFTRGIIRTGDVGQICATEAGARFFACRAAWSSRRWVQAYTALSGLHLRCCCIRAAGTQRPPPICTPAHQAQPNAQGTSIAQLSSTLAFGVGTERRKDD